MVKGRKWILKTHFQGCPKESDFELVEELLPPLEDGEILFKSEFISVDPYQRLFSTHLRPPTTMIGSQVAKVLESRDPQFPVGSRIVLYAGWVETGVTNPSKSSEDMFGLNQVVLAPPISAELSPSILLGVCGMPGVTAYFGLLERCGPRKGETVLVNSAAGAVGNVVGQIAKIKGCQVIGVAGSGSKLEWLRNELGFDHAISYKEGSLHQQLAEVAPEGIDCFFDNVGGQDSSTILCHMNSGGRIAVCGSIAGYNLSRVPMAEAVQKMMVFKELEMRGFQASTFSDQWNGAIMEMAQWVQEGKLKAKEVVLNGFEKVPQALRELFEGKHMGKIVVKI
ncbi:hypothetical protein TCAL_07525 [Tigriopus californicus]|uniref:Prostaglandin reductase 1 n=1 Tax=Tigriopus californicus TaxID=6832 RepID=A0A553NZQ0_TIGCA|nr:prostaglandin reductase 1-like [Tigriopus californicus]TRY70916.1 hypothetical protein TCAL_07525 [Tigriopus californicus]|eukprot:TCALIF_07525-PA protein Name:"Similar to PTGR1 Prostaglandin reductase 1 (Bos taurus)" AED:0.32 eAED:0.32 QI:115/1/1/1/1/1/3/264/337